MAAAVPGRWAAQFAHVLARRYRQSTMPLAFISSPYRGDINRNVKYVCAAMHDSLHRGESPYAAHALYTLPGVLDDALTQQRAMGMAAGYAWIAVCDFVAVYTDFGVSDGMRREIAVARSWGKETVYRKLFVGGVPEWPKL